jgi:hypothetical protein
VCVTIAANGVLGWWLVVGGGGGDGGDYFCRYLLLLFMIIYIVVGAVVEPPFNVVLLFWCRASIQLFFFGLSVHVSHLEPRLRHSYREEKNACSRFLCFDLFLRGKNNMHILYHRASKERHNISAAKWLDLPLYSCP